MSIRFALGLAGLLLASCASLPAATPVIARAETTSVPSSAGTGQLAIWGGSLYGPELTRDGFVVAAAESGGLALRDFRGAVLQHLPGSRLADVDLTALPLESSFTVVVGGTRRAPGRTPIAFFRLDHGSGETLRPWGEITTDLSDPGGFCMRQATGGVQAVAFDRRGAARQFTISEGPDGAVVARETRRFHIPGAGSACALAGVSGHLYVSHARGGFWRYPLDANSVVPPTHVGVSSPAGVSRSESIAIFTAGRHTYLASLDSSNAAFSLWRIDRDDLTWVGRIEVRDNPEGRRVRNLTAVDAYGDAVEGFPDGLIIVQGRAGSGPPKLHYIDWSEVKRVLGL